MPKTPLLGPEDFQYKQTRFLYYLFEYFGGGQAVQRILGLPSQVTIFQWRDNGYLPPNRIPMIASQLGVSPLLLNYPVASRWYAYFFNQHPDTWEDILFALLLEKPIMTEISYAEVIKLPDHPLPRRLLRELESSKLER